MTEWSNIIYGKRRYELVTLHWRGVNWVCSWVVDFIYLALDSQEVYCMKKKIRHCVWRRDKNDTSYFNIGCGNDHLEEYPLTEMGIKFCCYCGKRIREKLA